jgi:methylmalonyl-CoA mutase N-terminal domain/subunit
MDASKSSSYNSFMLFRSVSTLDQWTKVAEKELKTSKMTLEELQTTRITAEGIALQPVYYDLESDNPELPGVFPFTRGPYATM